MNSKKWQAVEAAAKVLGLGERATLAEIKQAFHSQSKLYHPDTGNGDAEQMVRITEAYEVLRHFCDAYSFPLRLNSTREDNLDIYDPEDWWRARFGEDPLWGSMKKRRR